MLLSLALDSGWTRVLLISCRTLTKPWIFWKRYCSVVWCTKESQSFEVNCKRKTHTVAQSCIDSFLSPSFSFLIIQTRRNTVKFYNQLSVGTESLYVPEQQINFPPHCKDTMDAALLFSRKEFFISITSLLTHKKVQTEMFCHGRISFKLVYQDRKTENARAKLVLAFPLAQELTLITEKSRLAKPVLSPL